MCKGKLIVIVRMIGMLIYIWLFTVRIELASTGRVERMASTGWVERIVLTTECVKKLLATQFRGERVILRPHHWVPGVSIISWLFLFITWLLLFHAGFTCKKLH